MPASYKQLLNAG